MKAPFKERNPSQYFNWKQLKGWVKMPIHKALPFLNIRFKDGRISSLFMTGMCFDNIYRIVMHQNKKFNFLKFRKISDMKNKYFIHLSDQCDIKNRMSSILYVRTRDVDFWWTVWLSTYTEQRNELWSA